MRSRSTGKHRVAFVVALLLLSVTGSITGAQQASGEGTVVFHRADAMKGKAIRFNIAQDGRSVGYLLAGTELKLSLPPGRHQFSVWSPSLDGQDFVTINVRPYTTHYIEGEIRWGWPAGRPGFGPVTESASAPSIDNDPADVLAGPALGATAAEPLVEPVANRRTPADATERGRIGLRNFIGDWGLEMWSLAADNSQVRGEGIARAAPVGEDGVEITIEEFAAPAFPEATGGGRVLIGYLPERGFTLESDFGHSDKVLRFAGQYRAIAGAYVFYLFSNSGGQTARGIPLSSARVEIRATDPRSFVADTYSSIDGESTHVQSYRFTRR